MYDFESINECLGRALRSQVQASEMLDNHLSSPESLSELLTQVRKLQHSAEFLVIKLLRELESAQAFDPNSRASFSALMHNQRFSRRELKAATRLSQELFEQPAGIERSEPIPSRMPCTARGMAAAAFGVASASEIRHVLDNAPEGTPQESLDAVEAMMAGFAEVLAPDDLRKAGLKILQGLNAESEPTDADRQRRRSVQVTPQQADLMARLSGSITPELKALLDRLFADYAGPGDLLPDGEKTADSRTADQRRHDALVAALKSALNPGGPMPPTRGCSTVVATMTLEQLQRAAGIVPTDVGTMLPIPDLIRLGADKNGFLAILEPGTGNLIELGRTNRIADVYAYLGLVASQGGDMTPGSDLPAALCEIHHFLAWSLGGLTTGNNLSLVGHEVHRNIDDQKQDPNKYWTWCTETGHMLWKLPKELDPDGIPRANFNPSKWFIPGQMLKFGLYEPHLDPPFQRHRCSECGKEIEKQAA